MGVWLLPPLGFPSPKGERASKISPPEGDLPSWVGGSGYVLYTQTPTPPSREPKPLVFKGLRWEFCHSHGGAGHFRFSPTLIAVNNLQVGVGLAQSGV